MGFRCLCLWGGAFTRILHFGVQTDTKTSLFNRGLVVYIYGTMLLIATRTSVYKQAPKQTYFSCLCLWGGAFTRILHFGVQTDTKTSLFNRGLVVYVYGTMLLIATRTSVYKQAQKQPFLNCLCLWGGAFTYILYFGVQTGTKTNLFLVVYIYVWCFFIASCTSMYKQAPKQTYF